MTDHTPPTDTAQPSAYDLEDAVMAGDAEKVREILRNNPELAKEKDPDLGIASPLHAACLEEDLDDIAEALLDAGAETNRLWIVDDSAFTPMETAITSCAEECAQLLIARGADIEISGNVTVMHKIAYEYDCERHHRLVIALLLRGVKCDIFAAVGLGLLYEVKRRLQSSRGLSKAQLVGCEDLPYEDYPFGRGETALHWAAFACPRAIRPLCYARADVDAVSQRNESALHWAAEYGVTESIQALLSLGANPNLVNSDGYSPLRLVRKGIEAAETTEDRAEWKSLEGMLRRYGAKRGV